MEKDRLLIERYFDLDLSDKELSEFEERLAIDADFDKKFRNYQKSITIVNRTYASDKEKERLSNWREIVDNQNAKTKKIPNSLRWVVGIAASLVLIFFGWQYSSVYLQNKKLIAITQESWDKNIGLGYYTTRSLDHEESKGNLIQAYKEYKKKSYTKSIDLLAVYNESSIFYDDVMLLKALSTHRLGDSQAALKMLTPLTEKSTRKISKVAKWYQGLIYLDINDIDSAKKTLILPNENNETIQLKKE